MMNKFYYPGTVTKNLIRNMVRQIPFIKLGLVSANYKCNKVNLSSSISATEIEFIVMYNNWLEIEGNYIPQNIKIFFQ